MQMRKNQTGEGTTIGKRRRMVGLTQFALAQQSGVSVQRLTFFETGRLTLDDAELERIRKTLKQRAHKVFAVVGAGV
jgi:transcriptional regulator with XRE-family HTH domain